MNKYEIVASIITEDIDFKAGLVENKMPNALRGVSLDERPDILADMVEELGEGKKSFMMVLSALFADARNRLYQDIRTVNAEYRRLMKMYNDYMGGVEEFENIDFINVMLDIKDIYEVLSYFFIGGNVLPGFVTSKIKWFVRQLMDNDSHLQRTIDNFLDMAEVAVMRLRRTVTQHMSNETLVNVSNSVADQAEIIINFIDEFYGLAISRIEQ